MNSPIDSDTQLVEREIEPGLIAHECPRSGGLWIQLQAFLRWKDSLPDLPAPPPDVHAEPVADDSGNRTLICPETGRLLIRYKVGHGLPFHVDRSPLTGSVWLDKGEWEALKAKGLHTSLNLIFTHAYQREVRSEEYTQAFEEAFRQRIGAADFRKVTEMKQWIENHPKRRDLCCYILDSLLPANRAPANSAIYEGREGEGGSEQ